MNTANTTALWIPNTVQEHINNIHYFALRFPEIKNDLYGLINGLAEQDDIVASILGRHKHANDYYVSLIAMSQAVVDHRKNLHDDPLELDNFSKALKEWVGLATQSVA